MTRTSKSPKTVALVAYVTAKQSLPLYSRLKSPKKFTQPQLVACLVLKEFFKTDYRGIMEILADSSDLQGVLELKSIPHYTTLQKAAHRLTQKKTLDRLMNDIIALAIGTKVMKKSVALSAIDSTGFESHHVSSYFVRRRGRTEDNPYQTTTYSRFPKVGIVVDCRSYMVLSGIPSLGPSPDIIHFKVAIIEALKRTALKILTADAGYDAEHAHVFARELGIRSIIPNRVGRPTKKLPSGKYRKIMATRFNKILYGQRWQIETINSVIKRRLGSFLRARTYWSQMREMMLRLFSYNVMVV